MSELLRRPSRRDKSTTMLSIETNSQDDTASSKHHWSPSRPQSHLTTNSEAWRRELAIVPAPLNLTPKSFQASQFEHTHQHPARLSKRPRNRRIMALHRAKRFSRLRDVAMADELDAMEEDEDGLAYVLEDNSINIRENVDRSPHNDQFVSIVPHCESCANLAHAAIPQFEITEQYDFSRDSGLPPSPLFHKHHSIDTSAAYHCELPSSTRVVSEDSSMVWFAAERENLRNALEREPGAVARSKSSRIPRSVDSAQNNADQEVGNAKDFLASFTARRSAVMRADSSEMTLTFHEWAALMEAENVLKKHGLEQSFRTYLAQSGIVNDEGGGVKEAELRLFGCYIEDSHPTTQSDAPRQTTTSATSAGKSPVTKHAHFSEPLATRKGISFNASDVTNTVASGQSDIFSIERANTAATDYSNNAEDARASSNDKENYSRTKQVTSTTANPIQNMSKDIKLRKKSTKYGLNSLFGTIERPISTSQDTARAEAEKKQKAREQAYAQGPRWMKVLGGLV